LIPTVVHRLRREHPSCEILRLPRLNHHEHRSRSALDAAALWALVNCRGLWCVGPDVNPLRTRVRFFDVSQRIQLVRVHEERGGSKNRCTLTAAALKPPATATQSLRPSLCSEVDADPAALTFDHSPSSAKPRPRKNRHRPRRREQVRPSAADGLDRVVGRDNFRDNPGRIWVLVT